MLAEITAQVASRGNEYVRERTGLYHLAGSGYASRLEWAKLTLELDPDRLEQVAEEILPVSTNEFPTPAQRPLFSALDCGIFFKTFGCQLPDRKETLYLAMTR